ncbi:hypothetical protein Tco_0875250 [Tanacetum coccineum]|uniref:Uncharacterized protein n=1 Tax=Tanacetum coccineum TaxID=301880 RepID=A0ABQ5BTT8_9ASTR
MEGGGGGLRDGDDDEEVDPWCVEMVVRKIHADLVQGLSLAFIDRHGVAELYGKLSSFEDERKVGIFMDE